MGLDAVEILLGWENAFGIRISDDEASTLRTPQMAIDLISPKVGATDSFVGICLGMRAYHRVRQAFCNTGGLPRKQIQLNSKLRDLLPKKQRQKTWKCVCSHAGLPKSPPFGFGVGVIFMPITVRDLIDWAVAHYPSSLTSPDERWTPSQVRSVVRSVVRDVMGLQDFQDDDDFVDDIGIS